MPIARRVESPLSGRKLVVDCRELRRDGTNDEVLAWVMSFPHPSDMHVVLPSASLPGLRRLQCTLQGMGCAVSRVRGREV